MQFKIFGLPLTIKLITNPCNWKNAEFEMLTKIYVDGLRSLNDFSLDLKPGLNVLVGPNGSGKSNILTAFELVSKLNRQGIHNLDSRINSIDVAHLFNIWRSDKTITIRMNGEVISEIDTPIQIEYVYQFELKFQPGLANVIYFSKQRLELGAKNSLEGSSTHKLKIEYNEGITKFNSDDNYIFTEEQLNEYYNDNEYNRNEIFKYNTIPNEASRMFKYAEDVRQEFVFDPVFNIFPEHIRFNIEESTTPGIHSTGSRLLSTLWEITDKKDNDKISNEMKRYPNINYEDAYEIIIGYFKQLSPEVIDLEVNYNGFKKIIESNVKFRDGKEIPLQFMSNGSLKWLSLITALITSSGIFLLEELENFIHPNMQQQFVELTRSILNFRSNFGILTTHSETILNSLELQEFYITYFHDGKTGIKEIDDIDDLGKVLNDTGFELGQYYTTGVLDFDPQDLPKKER